MEALLRFFNRGHWEDPISRIYCIWVFPKNRDTPKCMVYIGKPFKMDNLGVPPFKETSIYIYIHIIYIFLSELKSLSLSLSVKIYSIGSTRLVYLPT